jgi:hypothetical protein
VSIFSGPHHKLSGQERQGMIMIAEGKTMKVIAAELAAGYKNIATYQGAFLR